MPENEITLNIRKFDKSEYDNVAGGTWKRKIAYQDAIKNPTITVTIVVNDPKALVPAMDIDEMTVFLNKKNKRLDDYIPDKEDGK